MPRKQLVLVEAIVPGGDSGAHPEHPIYIPVEPPPGIWGPTDPQPTPPIFIPVGPDGIWGGGNVPMPSPPIANVPGAPSDPGAQDPGYGVEEGAHPDHTLPGDLPTPTHPIYIPVQPPDGFWGPDDPRPNPPIYIPVEPPSDAHPEHPIVLPPSLSDEQKEAIRAFLEGNLPPFNPPDYVAPV